MWASLGSVCAVFGLGLVLDWVSGILVLDLVQAFFGFGSGFGAG